MTAAFTEHEQNFDRVDLELQSLGGELQITFESGMWTIDIRKDGEFIRCPAEETLLGAFQSALETLEVTNAAV